MKRRIIALVLMVGFIISFQGCNTKNLKETNKTEKSNIEEQTLNKDDFNSIIKKTKEQEISAFIHLIYASKDRVIISGYESLLVYDFHEEKIIRALDVRKINMNHVQGDVLTIFNIDKEGSKILMYNDDFSVKNKSDIKDIYLYDVEKDSLSKADYSKFQDGDNLKKNYEEIDSYNNEYTSKYKDLLMLDYRFIDENNICFLLIPKKLDGKPGLSNFTILMVDKETHEEISYKVKL